MKMDLKISFVKWRQLGDELIEVYGGCLISDGRPVISALLLHIFPVLYLLHSMHSIQVCFLRKCSIIELIDYLVKGVA